MRNAYIEEYERVARSALSMWNRDPASPSFGSFDRQYWGWKYKDFSDATLQYAAGLAVRLIGRTPGAASLPELLDGLARYCSGIQHGDGSFDQCYPHERTPGVVYDVLSTLIALRDLDAAQPGTRALLDQTIERAARYALSSDERHGDIANHLAQYSFELLNHARRYGDPRSHARGEEYLERLLRLFDPEEGWFSEYGGADAGYQTRTLRYLAKIAELPGRAALWSTLYKALDFLDAVLMPDGSIHPMLGVRSTALLYPSSFEAAAARERRFAALAGRVRRAWSEGRVPLPSLIDFGNAIRLADDAFDAAAAQAPDADRAEQAAPHAPRSADFPRAGIHVRRSAGSAAYVAWKLGAALVVYGLNPSGEWEIREENAGYLLESHACGRRYVTRVPGNGELLEQSPRGLRVRASFFESLHDELTPWRMLVLRLLNLSVLRFQPLGDLFRKLIVRRLMTGRRRARLVLERKIAFGDDGIELSDRIRLLSNTRLGSKDRMFRCRRLTAAHMASSRYFQLQELDSAQRWMEPVDCRSVGEAALVKTIDTGPA